MNEYSLISRDTPLISNLSMIENIALIKEVHQFLSVKQAHKDALNLLDKLSLASIADKRINECCDEDVFYVMFMRAMMSSEKDIVIEVPFSLVKNLENIGKLIENILFLNDDKNIIILDNITNESKYKGYPCHIIK